MSKPVTDGEGHLTELGELIADDKAVDVDEWLDVRVFGQGYPLRLVAVAKTIREGHALSMADRQYLSRFRRQRQLAFA
ncbi:MAG: hypothetical protein NTU41_06175 [Chloroflexi bacterium]|nr:hypothetical protein [Chloroflexota bacterium]